MRHMTTTLFSAFLLASASAGAALAWGAIAVDHDFGEEPEDAGYFLTVDMPTRAAAANDALTGCRDSGNTGCVLVLTFQKCGAYAGSNSNYGVGAGNTLAQAERRAVADCNGPGCRVVVSDCQ